jgi:uncharacterized protein
VILADTGFWLALANTKDRHHARAKDAAAAIREPLVTTWPVLTEACHLLPRVSASASRMLLDSVSRGVVQTLNLETKHLPRVLDLLEKYRDLPMDLADASLVIAAEELGSGRILSTDQRDFRTYRWKNRKPFTNLLLPTG